MVTVSALQILGCLASWRSPSKGNGFADDMLVTDVINQKEDQSRIDPHTFGFAAARMQINERLINVINVCDVGRCVQA